MWFLFIHLKTENVNESQRQSGKAIHRETGQMFYYATRLLPEGIRNQTYVLYGFFRIADEVVDGDEELGNETKAAALESLRGAALGDEPDDDPVVDVFSQLRMTAEIPTQKVKECIDAMLADIDTDRYREGVRGIEYLP